MAGADSANTDSAAEGSDAAAPSLQGSSLLEPDIPSPDGVVLYWDTSAIVSSLFQDEHSEKAHQLARTQAVHLLSSLAWAQTQAFIARVERERAVTRLLAEAAREALVQGPWRRVNVSPDWSVTLKLSRKWPLRSADLWHLSAVRTLQSELPELRLVSFDERLLTAAEAEGFR